MRLPVVAAVTIARFLPSGTAALLIWLAEKGFSPMKVKKPKPLARD